MIWTGGADVRALVGLAVRIRFVLRDADLYVTNSNPEVLGDPRKPRDVKPLCRRNLTRDRQNRSVPVRSPSVKVRFSPAVGMIPRTYLVEKSFAFPESLQPSGFCIGADGIPAAVMDALKQACYTLAGECLSPGSSYWRVRGE